MGIFKIAILMALIKVLDVTDSPITCAGIYAVLTFILTLAFGAPFAAVIVGAVISFAFAFVYFLLLQKTEGSIFWWIILIFGALIGFV